jgi:hypothetical protein
VRMDEAYCRQRSRSVADGVEQRGNFIITERTTSIHVEFIKKVFDLRYGGQHRGPSIMNLPCPGVFPPEATSS